MLEEMSPNRNSTAFPYTLHSIEEELPLISTHTFSLADYVVIHQCDPPCVDCEFINISNREALQLSLREEKLRNEKYREKLNDMLKRYGQSLRQIEYQKNRIEILTKQLRAEKHNNIEKTVKNDYSIIEPSNEINGDEDVIKFMKTPKLEIITE